MLNQWMKWFHSMFGHSYESLEPLRKDRELLEPVPKMLKDVCGPKFSPHIICTVTKKSAKHHQKSRFVHDIKITLYHYIIIYI